MTMTLAAASTSPCALGSTNIVYGRTLRAPAFNALNSASTSAVSAQFTASTSAGKLGSLVPDSSMRKVGPHAFAGRISFTRLAKPKSCTLRPNASSTPKSESTETEPGSTQQAVAGPSTQSHLDLLERFTSESGPSPGGSGTRTIAQQLARDLETESEVISVPLGSGKVEMPPLTTSQKRNIRRQNYLNQVSQRNDVPFFTAVALFVLVPPVAILGVAVATGYVDLFP